MLLTGIHIAAPYTHAVKATFPGYSNRDPGPGHA